MNLAAVKRILEIKRRDEAQGLILVAANEAQVEEFAQLSIAHKRLEVLASWPGPTTWLLPKTKLTPAWITGNHSNVAIRISGHSMVIKLCEEFGGAVVSTSANRHKEAALTTASAVKESIGGEIDFVLSGEVGVSSGDQFASTIIDATTGERLR